MNPAITGLAVTIMEQERRMAIERLAMLLVAMKQVATMASVGLSEGASREEALEGIGTIAEAAIEVFSLSPSIRPGAGKQVRVMFYRRPTGFALSLAPHPPEFDVVDRMQVENAFTAISDWLTVTRDRQSMSFEDALAQAKEAFLERAQVALPGYRIVLSEGT